MADTEEYDSLVSQRSEKEAEKSRRQSIINDANEKLARLRPVKKTLAEQKSAFKEDVKKPTKECIKEKYSWKGSTYNKFSCKGNELISQNDLYYKNQLDRIHDEINNAITALENEKSNQYGLIGALVSEINKLSNTIENYFN